MQRLQITGSQSDLAGLAKPPVLRTLASLLLQIYDLQAQLRFTCLLREAEQPVGLLSEAEQAALRVCKRTKHTGCLLSFLLRYAE